MLSSGIRTFADYDTSTAIADKHIGSSSLKFAREHESSGEFYEDATVATEEVAVPSISNNFLLPTNMKPLSYNLVIKVYLPFYVDYPPSKNLTTEGEVTINIVVLQPTNAIVLNMDEIVLLLDKCEARSSNDLLTITGVKIEEQLEKVTFTLSEVLQVGQEISLKVCFI
ncbi:hypothetical protein Y032_0163g3484 [Ancylostoma ceylanicum]|nr:hypothetical protein Y032_0163g3484 [Ancylostoma ceylanicum]